MSVKPLLRSVRRLCVLLRRPSHFLGLLPLGIWPRFCAHGDDQQIPERVVVSCRVLAQQPQPREAALMADVSFRTKICTSDGRRGGRTSLQVQRLCAVMETTIGAS